MINERYDWRAKYSKAQEDAKLVKERALDCSPLAIPSYDVALADRSRIRP